MEASLVFPVIFLALIALLLFMVYMYQTALLYQQASIVTERASFAWGNSKRDYITGALHLGQSEFSESVKGDGLYWRWFQDALFSTKSQQINQGSINNKSLYFDKLQRSLASIGYENSGTMTYQNHFYKRTITATFNKTIFETEKDLPVFTVNNFTEVEVSSGIVEPVEFIRNVDAMIFYTKRIFNNSSNQEPVKTPGSLVKQVVKNGE